MQCPYCAYNSVSTNAPGPFLVKHFKDEHGMDFDTAVTELRRIKAGAPSEVAALRARVAELEGALVLERANRHQFSETSHAYFHGLLDIEDLLAQSDASPDRAEIARIICEARDTAERRVAKVRAAVNAAREGGDLT